MKFFNSYVSITTSRCLLPQININRLRINIQNYMLDNPVFHNISMDTYKKVKCGRNSQPSMLYLHWENTASQ